METMPMSAVLTTPAAGDHSSNRVPPDPHAPACGLASSTSDASLDLFRRAICACDGAAWESLMTQYHALVLSWIRQGANAVADAEDDDYWVTRTFTRFWAAIGPERFDQFAGIPSLLQYLKLCARSVLLDEARARQASRWETLDGCVARGEDVADTASDAATLVIDRLAGHALWDAVLCALQDDDERRVAYCSFVLGLTPREIFARHPGRYPNVADVYRVKRKALERLRRSREIRAFLGMDEPGAGVDKSAA
jgi:hypothetical protein